MNLETFVAALLGSFGTLLANLLLKKAGDRKYLKQVRLIIKESCRRIILYLETMLKEDKHEAINNIEARISGIKTIQKFLSEMDFKLISGKDIFAMYRVRELISDIIYDLEIFHKNIVTIQQYNINLEAFLHRKNNSSDKFENEIKNNDEIIDKQYLKLIEQINSHLGLLKTFNENYKKIAKGIYELNR